MRSPLCVTCFFRVRGCRIADSQSEEDDPPVAYSYVADINEEVQPSAHATWQSVEGGAVSRLFQNHFGGPKGEGEAIQDSSTPIQQGWTSPERLWGRLGVGEGAMAQDDGQDILRWCGDEGSGYGSDEEFEMVDEYEVPEVPPPYSESTTAQATSSTAPLPSTSHTPSPEGTPEPKEPPSAKGPIKPPQPIMSRRQLKTVLRGLREVVAEDRFLQAVALQATLDDIPHLWHLPQVSTPADLRERLHHRAEEGPPGLVLITQKDISKETLLELQCIGDLEQFTAVLITPKDQPQLETHIDLRGDLQISGIGPEITRVLDSQLVWSESSCGFTPKCYEDVRGEDLMPIFEKHLRDGVSRWLCQSMLPSRNPRRRR